MPRKARVIGPGTPHHIVQRGHNRNMGFVEDRDYEYYLENLAVWNTALGLMVYIYFLMGGHVHLFVDANERPGNVGQLIKRLADRQTRPINKIVWRACMLVRAV